jgi:TolB protein
VRGPGPRSLLASLALVALAAVPLASAVEPSPSGRIAFVSAHGTDVRIVVADGRGAHARELRLAPSIQEYQPAWSRNGKLIAYVGLLHGDPATAEILVSSPTGAGLRQLTRNTWEDDFPSWSPDGRFIAFYSFRPGGAGIYVMRADGSGVKMIERGGDAPRWGPAP